MLVDVGWCWLGDFFPLTGLWIYSRVLFPHVFFFWSNVFVESLSGLSTLPQHNQQSAQQHLKPRSSFWFSVWTRRLGFSTLLGSRGTNFHCTIPYSSLHHLSVQRFALCLGVLSRDLVREIVGTVVTWRFFFGGGCSSWQGQIRPDVHRKSSKWIRPGLRWPASLGFFRFSYNEWYEVISIYCILMYSLSLSSSISLCHLSGRFSRVFTLGFFGDFLQGTRKHIQPNGKLGKSSFLIPVPADMGYVIVPFWGVYFLPSYYVGIIYFLAIFRHASFFSQPVFDGT